jgi:hypothetical protein
LGVLIVPAVVLALGVPLRDRFGDEFEKTAREDYVCGLQWVSVLDLLGNGIAAARKTASGAFDPVTLACGLIRDNPFDPEGATVPVHDDPVRIRQTHGKALSGFQSGCEEMAGSAYDQVFSCCGLHVSASYWLKYMQSSPGERCA